MSNRHLITLTAATIAAFAAGFLALLFGKMGYND